MKSHLPTGMFDDLDLSWLRTRRSEKWAVYGSNVLPAWVAEMDFPLADPLVEVIVDAARRGDCGYAHPDGLADAFCDFAQDVFSWRVEPSRVSMIPDVMAGVYEMLRLVTKPGDGVVINPPIYPPFYSTIKDAGRRIVEVPLGESADGWKVDLERLARAFADGATAFLLCNPHNPTGKVFTRTELEAIGEVALKHNAFVIADEIHAPLTYPGARHQPYLDLEREFGYRAVVISGASKAWNIAGLKCAVLVAGSDAVQRMIDQIPDEVRSRTGHLGLMASVAAFVDGRDWLGDVRAYLDGNRQRLGELLAERLPQVRWRPPEATYLAWLDCRALDLGDDPAAAFLEKGAVALNAGSTFGSGGAGYVRLNFATSRSLLDEIVTRMAEPVD